ncbi:MAG: hypothetical protein JWQ87_5214, partial [Candidatus Sulfotelmatobacter sp.]|nr:hypothetical protein [Candidatus Sulfotelmatobacter sp.]
DISFQCQLLLIDFREQILANQNDCALMATDAHQN